MPIVCNIPASSSYDEAIFDACLSAGNVDVNAVQGDKTATGAQKETFGSGSAAQSEAGKKGGAISGLFILASLRSGHSDTAICFVSSLTTHAPYSDVV